MKKIIYILTVTLLFGKLLSAQILLDKNNDPSIKASYLHTSNRDLWKKKDIKSISRTDLNSLKHLYNNVLCLDFRNKKKAKFKFESYEIGYWNYSITSAGNNDLSYINLTIDGKKYKNKTGDFLIDRHKVLISINVDGSTISNHLYFIEFTSDSKNRRIRVEVHGNTKEIISDKNHTNNNSKSKSDKIKKTLTKNKKAKKNKNNRLDKLKKSKIEKNINIGYSYILYVIYLIIISAGYYLFKKHLKMKNKIISILLIPIITFISANIFGFSLASLFYNVTINSDTGVMLMTFIVVISIFLTIWYYIFLYLISFFEKYKYGVLLLSIVFIIISTYIFSIFNNYDEGIVLFGFILFSATYYVLFLFYNEFMRIKYFKEVSSIE